MEEAEEEEPKEEEEEEVEPQVRAPVPVREVLTDLHQDLDIRNQSVTEQYSIFQDNNIR